MSWVLTSIVSLPSRTLDAWSVFEVPFDGPEHPWTRHFFGWKREGCVGQVSTAVTAFDPERRRGLTRSGRVYELAGRPGMNADALAAWSRWKHVNGISEERDVTDGVAQLMSRNTWRTG